MKIKNLIVGLAVTTAFGTTAYAGGEGAEKQWKMNGKVQVEGESQSQAQERVREKREVSGTILQMKSVDVRGTDAQNVVALVKTRKADQRILLDLGPQSELRPLNLRQGSMIAAEGPVARLGDHQVMIASRIKSGDTELKIERKEQMDQAKRATANQQQQQRSATGPQQPMPPGAEQVPRAEPAPSPDLEQEQAEEQARMQEQEEALDRALEREREREEARVPTPDLEQDQSMNRPQQ